MEQSLPLEIEFISENPDINNPPQYKSDGASGFDICSSEDKIILPGFSSLISTGLKIFIKNKEYEIQIRSRSGLAGKNNVFVLNAPGTIDSDYQGEIRIILANFSSDKAFEIKRGDRIAQGILTKVEKISFKNVEKFSKETERGENGFGSTGIK
jgi:dUTP pyrophosphatase